MRYDQPRPTIGPNGHAIGMPMRGGLWVWAADTGLVDVAMGATPSHVALSPSNQRIVVAETTELTIWDAHDGWHLVTRLRLPGAVTHALVSRHTVGAIVEQPNSRSICWWNGSDLSISHIVDLGDVLIWTADLSPDGDWALIHGMEGERSESGLGTPFARAVSLRAHAYGSTLWSSVVSRRKLHGVLVLDRGEAVGAYDGIGMEMWSTSPNLGGQPGVVQFDPTDALEAVASPRGSMVSWRTIEPEWAPGIHQFHLIDLESRRCERVGGVADIGVDHAFAVDDDGTVSLSRVDSTSTVTLDRASPIGRSGFQRVLSYRAV